MGSSYNKNDEYNPTIPTVNDDPSDTPYYIIQKAEQLRTQGIVKAGWLGAYTADDFVLKSNMLSMAINPPIVVSTTFTIPADVFLVYVTLGGGGGGGATLWGCAGGAGQVYYRSPVIVTPGEIVDINIGAGGLAGYNFGSYAYTVSALQSLCASYHVSGYDGGNSSFGGYLTALGGKGAVVTQGTANPGAAGGVGGQPGELPVAMQGATKIRNGGRGGSSIAGVGGVGGIYPYSGASVGAYRGATDGIGYSSGGGGAGDYTDGSTLWVTSAGDGASGFCIVEW